MEEQQASPGSADSTPTNVDILAPYDPNLTKLTTQVFLKTTDYLHGEITSTKEHYALLEKINQHGVTKFADLQAIVGNISKTAFVYEKLCEQQIKPVLETIDQIEGEVTLVEQKAYQLDAYTKRLLRIYRELLIQQS